MLARSWCLCSRARPDGEVRMTIACEAQHDDSVHVPSRSARACLLLALLTQRGRALVVPPSPCVQHRPAMFCRNCWANITTVVARGRRRVRREGVAHPRRGRSLEGGFHHPARRALSDDRLEFKTRLSCTARGSRDAGEPGSRRDDTSCPTDVRLRRVHPACESTCWQGRLL